MFFTNFRSFLSFLNEIIILSKEENEDIKSSFYKIKATSLSRSSLKIVKTKTKVSGGFRSENSCENYCNTLKAKMRNKTPFKVIISVFNNENNLQTKRAILFESLFF